MSGIPPQTPGSDRGATAPGPALWPAAYTFAVVMMATTLPTPLYALYRQRFDLSALMITVLFGIYALSVVATLLLFGRVSDEIGRRPVMIAAVVVSLLSSAAFALADGVDLLVAGRVLSGISAGLITGTATATLVDLGGQRVARSTAIGIGVNMGGLAAGTLVCGVIADIGPRPLLVPFLTSLVLCGVGLAFAARLPKPTQKRRRLRIHRPAVPAPARADFTRTALAAGSGFAVTGLLNAVTAGFLATSLHHPAHTLAGAVISLAFALMGVGQLAARRVGYAVALPWGCAGLLLTCLLVATSLVTNTLVPLLLAAALLGLSTGACIGAGLGGIAVNAPPAQRAQAASAFFAVIYTMLALPVIGVGALTARIGLVPAALTLCAAVFVLTAAALASWLLGARPKHVAPEPTHDLDQGVTR